MTVTIRQGDAIQLLLELSERSVDCIITSPPYADVRGDYQSVALADYPTWSKQWLHNAFRVTTRTGCLLLNLGRIFREGEEQDYQHAVIHAARSVGWRRLDTLVWAKPNANPIRGRLVTDAHEYVYVFGREDAIFYPDEIRTPYAEGSVARLARRWDRGAAVKGFHVKQEGRRAHPRGARPKSMVTVYVGREKGNPHPAPMPLELAEHLVKFSCPPGGLVLDPFAGSGTTGLAALLHGCDALLFDVQSDYCELARERLVSAQQEVA